MPIALKKHHNSFREKIFAEITTIPELLQNAKFPSLNGVRGIAIIIVVMAHLRLSDNNLYHIIFNGELGVDFFFVLSGYLITTLCLKEKVLTGDLKLKDFYLRRILRIFPVAYLYLAVIIILNYLFDLKIPAIQFIAIAIYIVNLSYFRSNNLRACLGHYWSLATEEQFYIVFPFLIKKSFRTYFYFILFIVIILPIICTLQEFYKPLNTGIFYGFTHFVYKFQPIAIGCLFSILNFKIKSYNNLVGRFKIWGNLVALILIFSLKLNFLYTIKDVYINLIISFLVGYFITSNIKPSNDFIFKVLNSKILSFIGVLSYSIYIWQQLFTWGDLGLPPIIATFPYNMVFLLVISLISYYLYEKKFLKLKTKFKVL